MKFSLTLSQVALWDTLSFPLYYQNHVFNTLFYWPVALLELFSLFVYSFPAVPTFHSVLTSHHVYMCVWCTCTCVSVSTVMWVHECDAMYICCAPCMCVLRPGVNTGCLLVFHIVNPATNDCSLTLRAFLCYSVYWGGVSCWSWCSQTWLVQQAGLLKNPFVSTSQALWLQPRVYTSVGLWTLTESHPQINREAPPQVWWSTIQWLWKQPKLLEEYAQETKVCPLCHHQVSHGH